MANPTDWSGPNHSMVVECKTADCENKGKTWRVWLTKLQPGLLVVPIVVCDKCHAKPEITESCCNGD